MVSAKKPKKHLNGREVKGFMMNAITLHRFLDYCLENNIEKEEPIQLFLNVIQNKGYASFSSLRSSL